MMAGVCGSPGLDEFGDKARPTGLMGRPDAAAGIPVEVFVKQDEIPEMRIARRFGMSLMDGADAISAMSSTCRSGSAPWVAVVSLAMRSKPGAPFGAAVGARPVRSTGSTGSAGAGRRRATRSTGGSSNRTMVGSLSGMADRAEMSACVAAG